MENLRELLVAQRLVYDTVLSLRGIYEMKVEKILIHAARNFYSRYAEASNEKKKQELLVLQIKNKRQTEINLKEIHRIKAKILKDSQR